MLQRPIFTGKPPVMPRPVFLSILAIVILLSCSVDNESVLFPVDDRAYEICYVKNGELHFYDIASGEKLIFPDSSTLFNFAFTDDYQTLFYTVVESDSLYLKKASFEKGRVIISHLGNLNRELSGFVLYTTGEKSSMILRKDTVALPYGMGEHYGFRGTVVYAVGGDELQEVPNAYLSSKPSVSYIKQKEQNALFETRIIALPSSGGMDLYLQGDQGSTRLYEAAKIKAAYEGNIVPNEDLEYNLERMIKRSVRISPDSSKLLFDYPMAFFDLVHGPTCIVGLNGANLKVLVNDGIALKTKAQWLPDGNNVLYVRDGNSKRGIAAFDLFITVNEENESALVDEDVDYFVLRN